MDEKIVIEKDKGDILVVVDGENDFILRAGGLYIRGVPGEATNAVIIRRINSLARKPFDLVVTTEDCHPQGHIEFAIFWPHCAEGTSGQEYHKGLMDMYDAADFHLLKGQEKQLIGLSVASSRDFPRHISYSRSVGIKRIFIVGWAYTHCVGESAIAYATQGFETYVIRDCARSVPPPNGNPEAMDKKLELYGVKQVLFKDIR